MTTADPTAAPAAEAPKPRLPNYWDYLQMSTLLSLQGGLEGDEAALAPDELLFIVVHQAYELWFKQVLRELREAIHLLGLDRLDEDKVPYVVHHLRRVAQILRLAVEQFHVMETLTPQDFLSFRDKLVPASGFQSFQMRELEIRLGLGEDQRERYGETDALAHIKSLADSSPGGARAWSAISAARADAAAGDTLLQTVEDWLGRTPIEGSTPGSVDDDQVVDAFLSDYLTSLRAWQADQLRDLQRAGLSKPEELERRFAASFEAAARFLSAEDLPEGLSPAQRAGRRRARAGLLFIESHRELPLLAWPRMLIDTVVEVEEQLVLWRNRHARMVERVIGRRVGTGGSSGVEYLDRTTSARVFGDLWNVRTLLMPRDRVPALRSRSYYEFQAPTAP
jgi:tryptophan 2,3-dioxygenase